MSQALQQQKSQEYKTFTLEKRGKDRDVRVPQFPKKLTGSALKRAVGKLAWSQANDNRDKAVALVESWLRADYQLIVRMKDINLLSRECVDDYMRTTRAPMKAAITNPSAARIDGIRKSSIVNLMEYRLRQGKALGDANQEFLNQEAVDHRSKGKEMLKNAVWFEAIAKALPDTKTKVRDALKEADIERFLKAAQKVVA